LPPPSRREAFEVIHGVAQCCERRLAGCPDEDVDRQAAGGERAGGVVAARERGDGEDEQRLVLGEDAAR
jgi:hypothetical protein